MKPGALSVGQAVHSPGHHCPSGTQATGYLTGPFFIEVRDWDGYMRTYNFSNAENEL